MQINYDSLSNERKMLTGSYCTMEYAIESAAIFNPSTVEGFDQSNLKKVKTHQLFLKRRILAINNNLQLL